VSPIAQHLYHILFVVDVDRIHLPTGQMRCGKFLPMQSTHRIGYFEANGKIALIVKLKTTSMSIVWIVGVVERTCRCETEIGPHKHLTGVICSEDFSADSAWLCSWSAIDH
jgi:hypothetical protein